MREVAVVVSVYDVVPGVSGAMDCEGGGEEDEVFFEEGERGCVWEETCCEEGAEEVGVVEVEDAGWFVQADEFGVGDPGFWEVGEEA